MKPFACMLFAAALTACGGNVVVDSESNGTTTSSTTTGSTSADLTCTIVCEKIAAECSQPGNCAQSCALTDKLGNELCYDTYQSFLSCSYAAPASQCASSGCTQEANDLAQCFSQACQSNPSACSF